MTQSLESTIEHLSGADQWRVQSAELRDHGKNALSANQEWHEEQDQRRNPQNVAKRGPAGSHMLEDATVLRALLCHRRSSTPEIASCVDKLVNSLEARMLPEIASSEDDNLPILRAARMLTALAASPSSALSETAMYCYYVILRELHSGGAPDWLIGGARGGDGLPSCAFVTNECVHALLSFERSLVNTAAYIEGMARVVDRRTRPLSAEVFPQLHRWQVVDDRRAKLDFLITSELRKENIALKIDAPVGETGIDDFLETVTATIRVQMDQCVQNINTAINAVGRWYKTSRAGNASDTALQERIRSDAGHEAALAILRMAAEKAKMSLGGAQSAKDASHEALTATAGFLRYMARDVRLALKPSAEYVSRALDRELTAAASGSAMWDVGELLFASISHGYISGRWEEERLIRAGEHASRVISERGRFPAGQAIHLSVRGYYLHVLNVDVIRAFAELLRHTLGARLEPALMRRLMYFVEDCSIHGVKGGWAPSEQLRAGLPWRSATASTVLALDALNRMLDARINRDVFRHFSVRDPKELDVPALDELFYPDYGLASELCDEKLRRAESVAVTLERMRAHVNGVRVAPLAAERLYSLILHGPPGTGKSTLVESLAKTCDVRLVEVTPSDLIAGGVDAIERTARAVFQALSLLTRVVIVFDEFDPVLLQRQDDQKEATAFSFLTPGMLPKLKALHKAAKKRSVAYVLNTNLIGKLDDAAVRGGRFDAKVGVYPPDLLSRAGRLALAIGDFFSPLKSRSDGATAATEMPARDELRARFEQVVLTTRLGPMNTLAKPGWFTAPEGLKPRDDVFNYLVHGRRLPKADPEAEPRFSSDKPIAMHELKEYVWVDLWDKVARLAVGEPGILYAPHAPSQRDVSGPIPTGETRAETVRTVAEALQVRPPIHNVESEVNRLRLKDVPEVAELAATLPPISPEAPPPPETKKRRKRGTS